MKIDTPLLVTSNPVIQRLQIGVGGVLVVLAMVGLADMMLESASNETPIDAPATDEAGRLVEEQAGRSSEGKQAKPTEPLVDLGVVPDLPPENAPPEAQLVQPQPGQVVPDLAPNPERPRRER